MTASATTTVSGSSAVDDVLVLLQDVLVLLGLVSGPKDLDRRKLPLVGRLRHLIGSVRVVEGLIDGSAGDVRGLLGHDLFAGVLLLATEADLTLEERNVLLGDRRQLDGVDLIEIDRADLIAVDRGDRLAVDLLRALPGALHAVLRENRRGARARQLVVALEGDLRAEPRLGILVGRRREADRMTTRIARAHRSTDLRAPIPIAGSDGRGPRGSPVREGSKDADGPSAAEWARPENTLSGFHRVIGG